MRERESKGRRKKVQVSSGRRVVSPFRLSWRAWMGKGFVLRFSAQRIGWVRKIVIRLRSKWMGNNGDFNVWGSY